MLFAASGGLEKLAEITGRRPISSSGTIQSWRGSSRWNHSGKSGPLEDRREEREKTTNLGSEWTIRRYVLEGEVYEYPLNEQRQIPIMDAELLARLRKLGKDREWVFQSRNGTPINAGNVRKRFPKPVARELGIEICGWHDFRHSLNREMRRKGVDPKVRSGALGHKKVNLAMDVYDRCNLDDPERALGSTVTQLLPSCDPNPSVQ